MVMDSGLNIVGNLGATAWVVPSDALPRIRLFAQMLQSRGYFVWTLSGINDQVGIRQAYLIGSPVIWMKGTYYLDAQLDIPANSTTYFQDVTIECNAATNLLYIRENSYFYGTIKLADGNGIATGFALISGMTNVRWLAFIENIRAFTTSGFALHRGYDIKLIGGIRTTDNTFTIINSSASNSPSRIEVANIRGEFVGAATRSVIRLQGAGTVWTPEDIYIHDIHIKGDGTAVATGAPIAITGWYDAYYIKRVRVKNIKIEGIGYDVAQFSHIDDIIVEDFVSKNCGSINGGSPQFTSCKNVKIITHDMKSPYNSGLNIDNGFGAGRHFLVEAVTVRDGGSGNPGTPTRSECGIIIGSSTLAPGAAMHGVKLDDGGAYTTYTTEANNVAINDVPLMTAAPVPGDRLSLMRLGSGLNSGPFTAVTIKYSTPGIGVYTITWRYRADDGTWKNLLGVNDPTNGFTAPAGTYVVSWDLPYDFELAKTIDGVTGYPICAEVTAFTNMPQQPLGDQIWTMAEIQDITIVNNDCHNELGVTQEYGISLRNGAKRVILRNNKLNGNTAPFYNGGEAELVRQVSYDRQVSSISLDLCGGAVDIEVFHATKPSVLAGYTIVYTELSSADAGVNIRVGRYQDGVALDDDYFDVTVSEISQALGYSRRIDTVDLIQSVMAVGDTITVGTAGGKAGTGEVMLILDIIEIAG